MVLNEITEKDKTNSLLESIRGLSPSDWDYFHAKSDKELRNPFIGKPKHKEFIQNFLHRAGKNGGEGKANFYTNMFNMLPQMRIEHSNSIFFFGILIYEESILKDEILKEKNPPGYKLFPFLWFLTALFHDFGYHYEEDKSYLINIQNINGVMVNLLKKSDYFKLKGNIDKVPKTLTNNISNYFNKRRFNDCILDHGIIAGIYLYDRLVANRRKRENENPNDSIFWQQSLEKQYATVAATIAVHNMWFPDNNSIETYKKYNLDDLINHPLIKYKEAPLLFLLGIVDTLDPIKAFKSRKLKTKTILQSINIFITKYSIVLQNTKDSSLDFCVLVNKAKSLTQWIDVSVLILNNNKSIQINFNT